MGIDHKPAGMFGNPPNVSNVVVYEFDR